MKREIEKHIKLAITRHLVQHVQVPKEDARDRIDILADEAATAILKLVAGEFAPEKVRERLLVDFPLEPEHDRVPFYGFADLIELASISTCHKCGMPAHPVFGPICAADDCPGHKK